MDIQNQLLEKDPVMRIKNSKFSGKADASSGLGTNEQNFRVRERSRFPCNNIFKKYILKNTVVCLHAKEDFFGDGYWASNANTNKVLIIKN